MNTVNLMPHPQLIRYFIMLFLLFMPGNIPPAYADSAKSITIVALGDSLTAGYGLGAQEGFVPALARSLEKHLEQDPSLGKISIINAGVSGDTSAGALSRVFWSVPESADGVIVALGGNDALRGVPPELTEKNLDTIISKLKSRGQTVFLIGMRAPPNLGRDYTSAFDAIYGKLAQKHNLPYYPFFLDGVAGEIDLNLNDGIHPNAEGIKEIIKRITPALARFVKSINMSKY